ncbi:MAG: class I SAM-dependent methyltransferase [Methylococcales bacterium]|nr:class I SAM-dependent methyltransferase [Methylococcales bacterium]
MNRFYQKIFASGYDKVMASPEKILFKKRQSLISPLKGKILDVGIGTGVNFQFYHTNTTVIAVEPSTPMIKQAIPKIPHSANIQILNHHINDSALNNIIEANSLDAVICTLVLCTISKPERALQKFKHWLKPDGKLVILEHIHSKKMINAHLQNIINPIWKVVSEGCHLNRNTDTLIKEAGFNMLDEDYFEGGIQWYQGVFNHLN